MVSCRAFARAVVERGVCSFTALDVNSFDMVCYRHFWRAAWALERGVSSLGGCALGGGHRNGPGAYSFRLGTGLGAYFSGDLESKVLGLLEDSHVILFTSVAKMRGRQVWSAMACCSSCAAVVFSGNCGHVCLCSVLCNYVSCSMAQAYMSCLRLLHSGHLLCSGVMCVSLWYLTCRIQL